MEWMLARNMAPVFCKASELDGEGSQPLKEIEQPGRP